MQQGTLQYYRDIQQTWTEAVGSVLCRAALAAHIKAVPGAAMLVAAWCQHPKLAKVGCSE